MCLSTSKRSTTSAGVPGRPRVRLWGMPLGQGLVDRRHDLLVPQHPIGVLHPLFEQVLDLLGNQPVTKGALRPPGLNHGFFLARLGAAPSGRSSAWLSSQISSSASLSLCNCRASGAL